MPSISQLEYVVAVDKERNFHKAAQSCHITQPTLSKMIKNLEEELGVQIFDRSKNPIRPTQIGVSLIEQAKIALTEVYRLQDIVESQAKELKGPLSVGVIPTIAPYLLPLILSHFHKKYPLVDLAISELTTENCLQALENEEIDLALLATEEDRSTFFQDFLFNEKMYLYIHPKHSLAKKKHAYIEDLKAEDMWLLEEGHCLRDEIISFCHLRKSEKNRPLGLDIKIGNLESIRYLVQENFGYTLLPELSTLKISKYEKRLLRSFKKEIPYRKIYFTTRRKYLKKAIIDAFKEEVLDKVSPLLS